jgi:hypothetical protein
MGQDRGIAESCGEILDADDVVVVVMGEQDVGDRRPLALDPFAERIGRQVRVDQDAGPADLVDGQVSIGQPFRLFNSLQDQGWNLLKGNLRPHAPLRTVRERLRRSRLFPLIHVATRTRSRCGCRPGPPSARSRG